MEKSGRRFPLWLVLIPGGFFLVLGEALFITGAWLFDRACVYGGRYSARALRALRRRRR